MLKPGSIQHIAMQYVVDAHPELSQSIRVLDIGAGNAELISELARRGASCVALDYSAPPLSGIDTISHDLNQGTLPFEDETFDVVVATEVLEHLRMYYEVLREMVRVLKPGGLLIITIPNYWNLHYRIRYLLTGNLQRPLLAKSENRDAYLQGLAPHINTTTYPTLKAVLTWEGCTAFELQAERPFTFGQKLVYFPWYALVWLATMFSSRKRSANLLLEETNGPTALSGRRHILIACRRQGRAPNQALDGTA